MRVSRANKVDANQPAIVAALRKVGCKVQSLAAIGDGCPDLMVGWAGVITLMEVKDGSKPPSARQLTDAQRVWHAIWAEERIAVVTTPEEAIAAARACTGVP